MTYVAVKGGQVAIEHSIEQLTSERLQHGISLSVPHITAGLRLLIDQVMSEASLYAPTVASVAIKQAEGSPEEAVFLMRAFRSTLPRKHTTELTIPESMLVERRISAAFKDIPGGQILGSSSDYTHRLIDFNLINETDAMAKEWIERYHTRRVPAHHFNHLPKVVDYLRAQGIMRPITEDRQPPRDVTKEGLMLPASRSERLQVLTRGQTGAVTTLGYAALRGWGGAALHPTVGELRVGLLSLTIPDPFDANCGDDESYSIGEIRVTEVESFVPETRATNKDASEIEFSIGYGLCMGQNETKAIAMSILDNCLTIGDPRFPTHDEEFVLFHIDSVEATGFISHLKLPHYVTFQSKLDSIRQSRITGDKRGQSSTSGDTRPSSPVCDNNSHPSLASGDPANAV